MNRTVNSNQYKIRYVMFEVSVIGCNIRNKIIKLIFDQVTAIILCSTTRTTKLT